MTRQATDQLYIDLDYFTPEEYYVYVAEAKVESGFYIEPDYIEQGYYEDRAGNSTSTLTCELTEVQGEVKEFEATIAAGSTASATPSAIRSAQSTLAAGFQQTASISNILGVDLFAFSEAELAAIVQRLRASASELSGLFDCATDYIRIRTGSATADSEFASDIAVARSRDFDSTVEAAVSLLASVGTVKDTTISLNSVFQTNCETTVVVQLSANLNCNFTILTKPRIPSRVVNFELFDQPHYDPLLFSTQRKFGTHSLRLDGVQGSIEPSNTPIWTGTAYKFITPGYTWTSTNLTSWTIEANNLTLVSGTVDYQNNTFIKKSGNNIAFSTNGLDWTVVNPSIAGSYVSVGEGLLFTGGFWYILTQVPSGSRSVLIFRNSALSASNWTQVQSGTTLVNFSDPGAVKRVGNSLLFGLSQRTDFGASTNGIYTYRFTGPSSTTSYIGPSINNRVEDIAYDNVNVYYVANRSLYRNAEKIPFDSWTSALGSTASIDFVNGVYYTRRNGPNTDQFGTFISNSEFNVNNPSTINYLLDKPVWINNRFLAVNSSPFTGPKQLLTTSTDNVSYTTIEINEISGVNSSRVEYTGNFDTWKSIDLWFRITNIEGGTPTTAYPLSIGTAFVGLQYRPSPLFVRLGINNTDSFGDVSAVANFGNWTHLRILRNGANIKVYLNGTSIGTQSITFVDNTLKVFSGLNFGINDIWMDELYVSDQFLNDYASNSFSVPTQPYTNNTDTLLLAHFDNNFDDDAEPPVSANLSSSVVLFANAGKLVDATINFESISSKLTSTSVIGNTLVDFTKVTTALDINIERIRSFNSTAVSEFSTSLVLDKIRNSFANLQSNFNVVANSGFKKQFEFNQDAFASILVDASFIANSSTTISAVASISADVGAIPLLETNLNSNFDISIQADTIKEFTVVANSNSLLTVDAIKAVEAQGNLQTNISIVIDSNRIRNVQTDFDSIASSMAVVAKVADFFVNADCQTTLVANAVVLASESAFLEVFATIITNANITRKVAADLESTTIVNVSARTSADVVSEQSGKFDVVIDSNKITDSEIIIESAMAFDSLVVATRNNDIDLFVNSDLTADTNIIRASTAQLLSSTNADITAVRNRLGISNLESNTSVEVEGKLFTTISRLTYVIPKENRSYLIPKENRSYLIPKENRTHTVRR